MAVRESIDSPSGITLQRNDDCGIQVARRGYRLVPHRLALLS
jgi:hypothetical protein